MATTIQTAEENARLHGIYYREIPAPEAPYRCPRCASTFRVSDERRLHMRDEHTTKAA